jgi:uncharacterized repeat protein (TIGR03803 family)
VAENTLEANAMHRAGTRIAQTIAALALVAAHHPANAKAKLTTHYAFTGLQDGGTPLGGVTYLNGVLYGTTVIGGVIGTQACNRGCGTVFKVDPVKGGETVVYAFNGAPDGSGPSAGLIVQGGKLYGTTISGGQAGCGYEGSVPCGTVFSVDPGTDAEKIIYSSAPPAATEHFL